MHSTPKQIEDDPTMRIIPAQEVIARVDQAGVLEFAAHAHHEQDEAHFICITDPQGLQFALLSDGTWFAYGAKHKGH